MIRRMYGGAILSSVRNRLLKEQNAKYWTEVISDLCSFQIESDFPEPSPPDSIVSVLSNILTRGLPTLPSLFVEDTLSAWFNIADRRDSERTGDITFAVRDEEMPPEDLLKRALAVIDPRLGKRENSTTEDFPPTAAELDFLNSVLAGFAGDQVCQLVQPQRLISSLVDGSGGDPAELVERFKDQRVDFYIEFPTSDARPRRLIFELDDHNDPRQKILDKTRDKFCSQHCRARTIRILLQSMQETLTKNSHFLETFFQHPYAQLIEQNYRDPLYSSPAGMAALQLTLTPLAVTRLQLAVIEALRAGILKLESPSWRIAVIERDIPCAALALEDFRQLWENLHALAGSNPDQLPTADLQVYTTPEFIKCQRMPGENVTLYSDDPSPAHFDLLLDISILQRPGFTRPSEQFTSKVIAQHSAILRTGYSHRPNRVVQCAAPIHYRLTEAEPPDPLVYFLQNLFRKTGFREGQFRILRRTLAQENVIALLPTGAGKSLTYQLSALLQPGIVLIVDPLKSLMRDQDENLRGAGIDSTAFINSSIRSAAERKKLSERMKNGEFQFVFVSPERLQIAEFREFLVQMDSVYFSYVVVDEAHCVSEWGHDFRTSYLRLGENARRFCRPARGQAPIIGLTGTASFDVLADVQRELEITDDMAIVAPSKYEREELRFKVTEVPPPVIERRQDERAIQRSVGKAKQKAVCEILDEIPRQLGYNGEITDFLFNSEEYPHSGLVFCPHVGKKKGPFGVIAVRAGITERYPELEDISECFGGSLENDDHESKDLVKIQHRFKNNDLRLLVATKAFGMGIDKPNIRFTVHVNMPQSLEAFYQEAGRAGRDRADAYCCILYSRTLMPGEEEEMTVDRHLMMSFHRNSFRGTDFEEQILCEILDSIRYPVVPRASELAEAVLDRTGHEVSINLWERESLLRLYVNGTDDSSKGWINARTLILHTERGVPESQEILETIANVVRESMSGYPSIEKFLRSTLHQEPQPGIERIIGELTQGQSKQIVIGFTNDIAYRLAEGLSLDRQQWTESIVLEARKFCHSGNMFMVNLQSAYRKANGGAQVELNDVQRELALRLFPTIRTDQDTFKAIYRLSVVGAIDDYDVDYRTRTITARVTKRPDDFYIESLYRYLSRYLSREDALRWREKVGTQKGDTVLRKCLGVLVDFVYENIASKRKEAIKVMETAVRVGAAGGDFAEYVNTYFDSKFIPLLRPYLREYDLSLVWDFVERTKGEPDAVNHMRGACDRLLEENPENAALLILRSFARLLLPRFETKEAIEDLDRAWMVLRRKEDWNREEELRTLARFVEIAINHDKRLVPPLGSLLLQKHTEWMKQFNQRFWKGPLYA